MAQNGPMMMTPQAQGAALNMQRQIYSQMLQNTQAQPGGWQGAYDAKDRTNKAWQLITNWAQAMPTPNGPNWALAYNLGLDFEKNAYLSCQDKNTYDATIAQKQGMLMAQRQRNAGDMQNQIAARHAQQQQQQQQQQRQQLMLNQMAHARGMGQPGFQQVQHPTQVSPLPQQSQQMPVGMTGLGMMPNPPTQRQFPVQMGQPRQQIPGDLTQLSNEQRAALIQNISHQYDSLPEDQKHKLRQMAQAKIPHQQLSSLTAQGKDIGLSMFQQQLMARNNVFQQQQRQGMPANALQRPQHQGPVNPMMNSPGLPQGLPENQPFPPNMEAIRNEQHLGQLAQQRGQMVVPATSGPGRNAIPGSVGGIPPQTAQLNHPGHAPQPPPGQQPFHLAAQAQARAASRSLQGQPGGLAGLPTTSQSPAMNTLTAPLQHPPVPLSQAGRPPPNQNNNAMGVTLNPQFNHQNNVRPMSSGNLTHQQMVALVSMGFPGVNREAINGMPEEKLRELLVKWTENRSKQGLNASGMPGISGQAQAGAVGGPGFNPNANIQPGAGMMPSATQAGVTPQQPLPRHQLSLQNPQNRIVMDSMDLPPMILNQMRARGYQIPAEVKKWIHMKQWASQSNLPSSLQNSLNNAQLQQFASLMNKTQQAGQPPKQGLGPLAGPAQPLNGPSSERQSVPNYPQLPSEVQIPQFTASPAELENMRKSNPSAAAASDEHLTLVLKKLKTESFVKRYWEQQQQQRTSNPGMMAPRGFPQVPQPSAPQPETIPPAPPANMLQNSVQQATPAPEPSNSAQSSAAAKPGQKSRPGPAEPSPIPAPKANLKRPNPNEAVDVPNHNNVAMQRAPSQEQRVTHPMPLHRNAEQNAKTAQHQQWQVEVVNYLTRLIVPPEDMARMKQIIEEERQAFAIQSQQNPEKEISMSPEERQETLRKLQKAIEEFRKITKYFPKWFHLVKDEQKTRIFFRMRLRIVRQCADGDSMSKPRDKLTMSREELDQAIQLAGGMTRQVMLIGFNHLKQSGSLGGQPPAQLANQPAGQQAPQPTPLSVANLEKQTQALKQAQNRPPGKPGQPPAAPTTTQPPFQIGGQKSPTGQPIYLNKPPITQDNLQLPPRKKPKHGLQPTSSPAAQQAAGTSPQLKVPSPEVRRQPASEPLKPPPARTFPCPERDCDMHTVGFNTEEARENHIAEEHAQPEDPFKFVNDHLSFGLGLDASGNPKPAPKTVNQDTGHLGAPPMTLSQSRQGQTPRSKPDMAATPMSRDASMRRHGSATGIKGSDSAATPGGNKNEGTPRPNDGKLLNGKHEAEAALPMAATPVALEDPWANATIDPQTILASFAPIADIYSDFGQQYRSQTPNDTPESSKDSGASEPNSDISEGVGLEIDLNWRQFDESVLPEMESFGLGAFEGLDASNLMNASEESYQDVTFSDNKDFSKPFETVFDTSGFWMDTA